MTSILSKKGLERVRRELDDKNARLARVCAARDEAFEQCGDGWHDNPEFNRLQQMEAALNHEIHRLKGLLERATVLQIDEQSRPCDCVRPGAIVELVTTDERTGRSERALWVVGGDGDTDLAERVLGWDSPVARAIAHARVGDVVDEVRLGPRQCTLEILALHPSWPLAS